MRPSLFALLCLASACGPLTFTTEVTGEGVVPGSALGGLLGTFPQLGNLANMNFDNNQDFQNNKVTRDHVQTVKVQKITLNIVSPNDQDFSFLDTLQFVARTGDTESVVAEKKNIAGLGLKAPNPTLTMDLLPVDLANYVKAPTMSLVMRGTGHQPGKDTKIDAVVKLEIGATP